MQKEIANYIKLKLIVYNGFLLVFFFTLNLFLTSSTKPYIKINEQIPIETVYEEIYQTSCKISGKLMSKYKYFGGYLVADLPTLVKKICIEIDENGEIEKKMKESNIEISLEDPLKSAQYIWIISRMKYNFFIMEAESYAIWISVLKNLRVLNTLDTVNFLPEYRKIISYIPKIPGKQMALRQYPNKDDFLFILSISTRIYKGGKFATDFTGGKILFPNEIKKNNTPLINSNIEYYLPILMKLYPPSFDYQDLISTVSFVYRMIYYCTGNIIFPIEAWEITGLVYSLGGGGNIPKYNDEYAEAILTQDQQDNFPEERNFFVVLERLIQLQPSWDVLMPPMYGHRKEKTGGIEDHELFKFMEFKGMSIPHKNSKDIDGVIVIYFIFRYLLKLFISIETARDLWIVTKNWLTHSTDYYISNNVSFLQSERYIANRKLSKKTDQMEEIPKWATGNRDININSEIISTFISEFENEFPYIITCPEGELALKNSNSDIRYKYNPQRVQKTDRIAVNIAKEIHALFPSVKFRKICGLASSFSLIVPFDIKLFSKFTTRKNGKHKKSKMKETKYWKFSDNLEGIEFCRKGILSLLEDGKIDLEQYDEFDSIHIIDYLDSACLRIIKSQVKCNIETPYYFPYQVSNTINTFSGNIAFALASSFVGETNYYREVIGTIWDGKLQSVIQEETLPSLFRFNNPGFNPESLCNISEYFINPAIIGYFEKKKLTYLKKIKKKQRITDFLARIKEKYYTKTSYNNVELFYSDLMALKEVVNAHKIPKGANLDDWKEFVLDEESISSFILSQFKKPSDFDSVCKTLLERKLRNGDIQFFPILTDSSKYKEYLLNRKKRTKIFFKKLVKDGNSDFSLKEISNLLMFKDESLLEFPETVASNIRDSILYDRFDLQFKNFIQWYIHESCSKASSLVYKSIKAKKKKKCFPCCYSLCYNFFSKSDDSIYYGEERSKYGVKIVEEALEFGLKIVMNNPNVKLYISTNTSNNMSLQVLEQKGITLTIDLTNKDFIIKNASFIYIYLSSISVPITKDNALLASEIASLLLNNYQIHGEAQINDKVTNLSSVNRNMNNVGDSTLFNISHEDNPLNTLQKYCSVDKYNERSLELLNKISLSGNYKNNFNKTFLHWSNGYLSPKKACEIVENLTKSGIINDEEFPEKLLNTKNCLDFVSYNYPKIPHIPIPVCISQQLMMSCNTGNNLVDLFASIILSRLIKFGKYNNLNSIEKTVCSYSKILSMFYNTHRFKEECKDLFTEIFGMSTFIKKEFSNTNGVELLIDDICNDINLMHSCKNISSNKLITDEINRVSDIIISEIKNEFSDFDFYWRKDNMCETANEIIRFGIEDCAEVLKKFLNNLDYEFPLEFEKTICSKINVWPRVCAVEKFSNHSVFSNLFYNYIVVPMLKDNLFKNQKVVNEMNFHDICYILENNYSDQNDRSGNSVISITGLDTAKICTEYFEKLFPKDQMYEQELGLRIIEKKKECEPSISKMFVAIVKDEGNFLFFDNNLDYISRNFIYLPNYMHPEGLAHILINKYKVPPRVTLITIGLQNALDELNSKSEIKYEFSTLGLIYNSVKIVIRLDTLSEKDLLLDCMNINKDRIFPKIGDTELEKICRHTMLSFENTELVENIYLLYSINNKVASYYSTHFTSENISFISKTYVSKVLRGKPSLAVQKLYEKVLNEYIDYIFEQFDSYLPDPEDPKKVISIYKRLGIGKINKKKKLNAKSKVSDEKIETDLDKFLNESVYKSDVQEKNKEKLAKALIMFNFLMETKRLGVFQTHMNAPPFEISQEISSESVLKFMPPDLANWLTSYTNYNFVKMLFVVPIYSDSNKVTGPIANLDIENNILYDELLSKGVALNRVMNILESRQKLISGDKKIQISATILESTIRHIIDQYSNDDQLEFAFSIINNSYIFRNAIKKLTLNKEIIYDLRDNINPTTLILNGNFVALEAIEFFLDRSPSELISKTDFIFKNFDFVRSLYKDSLFYYKGDINSTEMRHIRKRFFCQSFNKQIMRNADNGLNPFFECYYFRVENGSVYRENRHIEGKTSRYCEFTGNSTRTKTSRERYLLHKRYLKFLFNDSEFYYHIIGDSLRLTPEVIMKGIGRVYGYCLLIGEPLNFYFNNFILRYLKTGEPNNESNIKNYVDNRIEKFETMINLSFNTLDSKNFLNKNMDFKNAKKKVFKDQPIYYYVDQREYEKMNGKNLKSRNSNLFEVNNFSNLRFLGKMISNFIRFEKFQLEIESFFNGVYDMIPRRFLRSFNYSNLFYFSQGYIGTNLKNEVLVKSLLTSFFYVENDDILLAHKRNVIKWFHTALNSFTYTDVGFFFATFTGKFSIFPPTAYAGKIRIVAIPLDEEKNSEKRIIIDPLLLVIYIPNYKTYIEVENGVSKIIEMNKRKLLYSA
ncbi:uncharacterized protein cubi_02245 [Cryptosporidium ubiquitum]|uniref:Uncharacterized protein n=1 Tax=Cryptosporidium ubiquitum TaxID=857276 RepID=A0A1J4MFJ9_9CRYT|nr:uncharacterized protein cubi_02245 [Cryptosporidium ubiquitum]OII73014.1 hypothetical protein cubi_02245 [Cryptosporidium ubiquitum]